MKTGIDRKKHIPLKWINCKQCEKYFKQSHHTARFCSIRCGVDWRFSTEQMTTRSIPRLFSKVNKNGPVPTLFPELGPCWIWEGKLNWGGYGHVSFLGRQEGVHRVSWKIHFGVIPEGMSVLHHCDVRNCINPLHLFTGTQKINLEDMASKSRSTWGEKNPLHKLSTGDVLEIKESLSTSDSDSAISSLAKKYGVTPRSIRNIKTGKTWSKLCQHQH